MNATNYTDDKIKNAAGKVISAYDTITTNGNRAANNRVILNQPVQILNSSAVHDLKNKALKISIDGTDSITWLKNEAHSDDMKHLGIKETCWNGKACGLQDYRTSTQKTSYPEHEINRYGKESHYTDAELRDTADKIIVMYGKIITENNNGGMYEAIMEGVEKVCIAWTSGSQGYTWNATERFFGVDPNADMGLVENRIKRVRPGSGSVLDEVPPIGGLLVQLQPTNEVRVAPYYARKACFLNQLARRGAQRSQQDEYSMRALARTVRPEDETRTEQPVVAEGGDKEPKLNTVAQRFERMNRSAIARNNRNIKSMV